MIFLFNLQLRNNYDDDDDENQFSGLSCRPLEEPNNRSRVNILMRNFAHTGTETP